MVVELDDVIAVRKTHTQVNRHQWAPIRPEFVPGGYPAATRRTQPPDFASSWTERADTAVEVEPSKCRS